MKNTCSCPGRSILAKSVSRRARLVGEGSPRPSQSTGGPGRQLKELGGDQAGAAHGLLPGPEQNGLGLQQSLSERQEIPLGRDLDGPDVSTAHVGGGVGRAQAPRDAGHFGVAVRICRDFSGFEHCPGPSHGRAK